MILPEYDLIRRSTGDKVQGKYKLLVHITDDKEKIAQLQAQITKQQWISDFFKITLQKPATQRLL